MFSLNHLIRIWDKWWYLQSTSVNPKKQKMWKSLEAVMLSSPFARICIYLLNWRDADSDPQFLMEGSQTVDGSLFTKVKTIRIQIIFKVLMDDDEWNPFSGHNGCGSGGQGAQTGQGDEDTEGLQGANIYTNWYKLVPF